MIGNGLGQLASQYGVDLDCGHLGSAIQQRQRQRSESGTHLEHVIMAVDPRRRNDATNGIRIVYEVLTKRLTRPEVEFLSQVSYLGPPEEPNRQDAPTLPLHTGQAPQP